ncbi:MAG: GFA family protein [Rhizobiales bacterium]|nr:GFA family protein [Hyphomicrobiales bacterium]
MSSVELEYSGGCQCGAVRYKIAGPLGKASVCHCRMCQKAFGNLAAPLVGVPLTRFRWTRGKPGEFRSSAPVARGFCAHCGTPLYLLEDGDPNIELAICTLDNPNASPPTSQVGIEGKVDWADGLAQLPGRSTNDDNPLAAAGRYHSLQHPDND